MIAATNIDYLRPNGASSHGDDRLRVVGTLGQVEVIGETVRLIDASGERVLDPLSVPPMLDAFISQCQGGPVCPVSAEDALAMTLPPPVGVAQRTNRSL